MRALSFSWPLTVGVLLTLTACGRPGLPLPPERVSPQPATDLSAVVLDRAVELAWTMPSRRADNARLRDLIAMHVFRAEDDGAGDAKPALVSLDQDNPVTPPGAKGAPADLMGSYFGPDGKLSVVWTRYVLSVPGVDSQGSP